MEPDINVLTISGLIVTEIEFRIIPSTKDSVALFRIVSNDFSFCDGRMQRRSTYVTVKLYAQAAERAQKCLSREAKVTLTGKLVEEIRPATDDRRKTSHLVLEANAFQVHSVSFDPLKNGTNLSKQVENRNGNAIQRSDANTVNDNAEKRPRLKPIIPPVGYN